MSKTPTIGQHVAILLGYATAHCAIGITMSHGYVSNESEKAIEVTGEKGKCWFPRKALKIRTSGSFELAQWFKPTGWTAVWLDRNSQSSVISA